MLVGAATLFILASYGGLWLFYRSVAREASFETPGRRRWARRSPVVGLLLAFAGIEFLVVTSVLDLPTGGIEPTTSIYVGIGTVLVAGIPIVAGLGRTLSAAGWDE